ncbi:plasmid replication initiation protein [Staphylococcus epidermidis]
MLSLTYIERSGLSFKKFVLFTGYEVDVYTQKLIVSINPKSKKGRKIEWLEFTFDAEKRIHNKRQPQKTKSR